MLVELNAKKQEKQQIAKTMLAEKEPVEKIIKYTGLTLEEIEQLRTTE
jgi:hypothetical protein